MKLEVNKESTKDNMDINISYDLPKSFIIIINIIYLLLYIACIILYIIFGKDIVEINNNTIFINSSSLEIGSLVLAISIPFIFYGLIICTFIICNTVILTKSIKCNKNRFECEKAILNLINNGCNTNNAKNSNDDNNTCDNTK